MHIRIVPSTRSLPPYLDQTQWLAAVEQAAATWNSAASSCQVNIHVAPPSAERTAVEDGVNLLMFRDQHWCHNERCGGVETYPGRVMAMTTTYPSGATGRDVVEADIELNALRFHFGTEAHSFNDRRLGDPPNAHSTADKPIVSLHAVLVHELGHVLGLTDSCTSHSQSGTLRSSDCPAAARQSVMHAPAQLSVPTTEDVEQLCALYPPKDASPHSSLWASTLGFAATLVGAILLTRHRRRRSPPAHTGK